MKVVLDSHLDILNGEHTKPNDCFATECEDYSLGLFGIVLNNTEMDSECIKKSLIKGETQKKYKGSYVMWLHDKTNQKIYVANDLLSKQSVYYYCKDGLVLINTSLFDLCADIRRKGRKPEINYEAVDYFVNSNVFYGDNTYEVNTHFLTAYSFLVIDCNTKKVTVKRMPIPKMKTINEISAEEAIDSLERLFSEGCHLQWQKNEIYKNDQIITISGGMDSRAVLLHLCKEDGFARIKSYTYAQSGSNDSRIAQKITTERHIDNTFIPLDGCSFAFLRDEIVDANEGQMFYLGSTGAILMAKKTTEINAPGIVHTGLGGGEIMGDMCVMGGDKYDPENGMATNQKRNLDDIRRCLNFQKTTSKYFAAFSPFLYEDFFEFVLTVPAFLKMHRKLYIQWYKQYMHSDFPSSGSYSLIVKGINRVKIRIFRMIRKRNPADMNPIQYWYDTNQELRKYIEKTWQQDSERLKDQEKLLAVLEQHFEQSVVKKFAVLTVTRSLIRILGLA